jgi:hypothetical protein
VYLAKHLKL